MAADKDSFLQELARPRPDPGGGAAAAYGASLGLALLDKVLQLEERRPEPQETPGLAWREARERLLRVSENLEQLRQAEVRAYFQLSAARAAGDPGRLAAAVQEAVDCPRRIMAQAGQALELLAWAGAQCQKHLISDLLVAGEFLAAAQRGAYYIAAANLPLVADLRARQDLARRLKQESLQGEDLYHRSLTTLLSREQTP